MSIPACAEQVFEATAKARKGPANAIADLALDNFIEMRDRVGDPTFIFAKRVEAYLASKFPTTFRYAICETQTGSPFFLLRLPPIR